MLDARRLQIILILLEAAEGAMSKELLQCSTASKAALEYMAALAKKDLWPPTKFLKRQCIADFLCALADVPDVARPQCCTFTCSCGEKAPDDRWQLLRQRDTLLRQRFGLCLDCVRRGGNAYQEGHCRVKHD